MTCDGGLRKLFKSSLPDAQWTAIESGITSGGIPDHNYCFRGGKSGWIEHKKCVTDGPIHHMRPLQISWLEQRCRYGGLAFVAVRWLCDPGKRRQGRDELHLFNGMAARHLKTGGITSVPSQYCRGAWDGGPAKWNWVEVRLILIGEGFASP